MKDGQSRQTGVDPVCDSAVLVSAVAPAIEIVHYDLPAQCCEFSFLHVSTFLP